MKWNAAMLTMACTLPVTLAAQSPAADPWQRVPPLPTSCLADEFPATVRTLRESIERELATQKETNDRVAQQFQDMDMQEKMRRMQAFMAKNPQDAMKVMQAIQGGASTTSADLTSADESKTVLEEQFPQLEAAFREASEASAKPLRAKQGQMIDAKSDPYAGGNRFKSKADQDAFMDLLKQEDAAYEKACAPFFGSGGRFHAWLAEYRTRVAMKTASGNDANENIIATQISMLGSPSAGYRTTGQLTGVRDYLAKIEVVYAIRYGNARPPMDLILIR